jgi:hypothetical protein
MPPPCARKAACASPSSRRRRESVPAVPSVAEIVAEGVRLRLRSAGIGAMSKPASSLRLAAQDVALSRRKQGFESPRERQ